MTDKAQLPPQNIDVEESILASCMLSPIDAERAADILKPEDFYRTRHRDIFTGVIELVVRGEKVDLITLTEAVKRQGKLQSIGGASELSRLLDTAPMLPNIEKYCDIIKDLAVKRTLLTECNELSKRCFDQTISGNQLLDSAQQMVTKCEGGAVDVGPVMAGDLCMDIIKQIETVNQTKTGITGLRTGFYKLDRITGGLQKTDLIIIAGRPGMGKTAFAMDLAKQFCGEDHAIFFESLEMSKEQLVGRMASKISGVSSVKLRAGGINQGEWSRLMDAFGEISEMSLMIENPKNNDFDAMRRKIRRAKREKKIDAVIIDYLQLLSRKGDFNRRKDLEIGSMTRDLKLLANDLEIPVILLSQLNRKLEERSSKEPMLSDLRESGAIEQDADMILFLHRADAYKKESDGPPDGIGDLIIAKHRHGPTGRIKMIWHEETASYRNFVDPQQYNQQRE